MTDEPLHIFDPRFKYTTAKEMGEDYLKKKFKKRIAEQKAGQKEAQQPQPSNVRQWRKA